MKKSDIFAGIDAEAIIKKSIESHLGPAERAKKAKKTETQIDESYVHEPKQYKQVSEFVSQKTKNAHVELYKGYVDAMNKVSTDLDTADRGAVNSMHSQFRSLKLDESYNLNATWLHELYFANCFDPHSEIVMDSMSFIEIQRAWGTFDDWQKDFMACALSAGSGWAIFGFNIFLKNYVNTVVSNNSQDVMLGLYPIVVLDVHEHAYAADYKTDKKSYVIAMMRQIDWEVVEERVKKAKSIAAVLK